MGDNAWGFKIWREDDYESNNRQGLENILLSWLLQGIGSRGNL